MDGIWGDLKNSSRKILVCDFWHKLPQIQKSKLKVSPIKPEDFVSRQIFRNLLELCQTLQQYLHITAFTVSTSMTKVLVKYFHVVVIDK